jgi:hypothetical protein
MNADTSPSTEVEAAHLRDHLERALEHVDHPEARYHLREALQLLVVFEDYNV